MNPFEKLYSTPAERLYEIAAAENRQDLAEIAGLVENLVQTMEQILPHVLEVERATKAHADFQLRALSVDEKLNIIARVRADEPGRSPEELADKLGLDPEELVNLPKDPWAEMRSLLERKEAGWEVSDEEFEAQIDAALASLGATPPSGDTEPF